MWNGFVTGYFIQKVFLITREDVLGKQRAVYRIKRVVEEDNEDFGDGAYIVYVNASYQDLSEVGRLIHDLHCTDAAEMYSEVLAERVWELKETERGVENMCHELEMLYQDGVEEGIKLGERKGEQSGIVKGERQAILRSILHIVRKMKISPDEAMDMLEIGNEEREEYRKKLS